MQITCVNVEQQSPDAKRFSFTVDHAIKFIPGQFLTIEVDIAGESHQRCYSISSSPRDYRIDLTIKRIDGGLVSNYLFDNAKPGMTLKTLAAAGDFNSDNITEDNWVVLAAGSGITPLYSMVHERLLSHPNANITMSYSVQAEEDKILREELDFLAKVHPNFKLDWHLTGENNWLDIPQYLAACDMKEQSTVMTCGPELFMDAVISNAEALNFKQIMAEVFTAAPTAQDSSDTFYQLMVDGRAINAGNKQSLLEALEANDVAIKSACRSGSCGSCVCQVVDGDVKSAKTGPLTQEQIDQGYVLSCVSSLASDATVVTN